MTVWSIVVAAGGGARFGASKQFATLGERPVVCWSVEAARVVSDGVVLVLPGATAVEEVCRGADTVVTGGATRAASVRAGLDAVPEDATVVVVHDGVRPLAPPALFHAVVDAVRAGADGAVPGLPVVDTIKRVAGDLVLSTVSRDGLVTVQTPQAFRRQVLRAAHDSGAEASDDAALVEALGATVRVVPGDARNLKITTPADLELARALLAR